MAKVALFVLSLCQRLLWASAWVAGCQWPGAECWACVLFSVGFRDGAPTQNRPQYVGIPSLAVHPSACVSLSLWETALRQSEGHKGDASTVPLPRDLTEML